MKRMKSLKASALTVLLGMAVLCTIMFSACPNAAKTPELPAPAPKHAITFSVEGSNGTLKAKADGVPETSTSPINIEEGKTVTFTAKANDGYRVKGWTLDGKPITEAGTNTEYKLKVSKPATVKVSFEEIPKHAITFSVDSTTPNGTLKAKADGVDETSTSPITVEEGKTVTFTAEPSANYKVKEWKVGDTVVTGNKTNTYTHTVTQATTVSVSFELSPVEGGAVLILSPDKLTINIMAVTEDGSDIAVEGCTETTLKSGDYTELHAKGTKVILKGNIVEFNCQGNRLTALDVQGLTSLQKLYCPENQLTALNVQGLTSLRELECLGNQLTSLNVQGLNSLQLLYCQGNQLTSLNMQGLTALEKFYCAGNQIKAQAMTEILNALPAREASDGAFAILHIEGTGFTEGNCKDFSQPAELKTAFDGAKSRNWKLVKINANGDFKDL